MRTKTLLLAAAAALAAGILSSSAQVYSANVVGYVSIAVPANPAGTSGFAYAVNPLTNDAGNDLGTLFTNAPTNTKIWEFVGGTWVPYTRRAAGNFTGGYDGHAILPGEGFLIQSPTGSGGFTNTFVGEVIQGTNIVTYLSGASSSVASIPPISGLVQTTLGFPAVNGDKVWTYDSVLGWLPASKHTSSWTGSWASTTPGTPGSGEPLIQVGQAFFVQASASSSGSWTNVFISQ